MPNKSTNRFITESLCENKWEIFLIEDETSSSFLPREVLTEDY